MTEEQSGPAKAADLYYFYNLTDIHNIRDPDIRRYAEHNLKVREKEAMLQVERDRLREDIDGLIRQTGKLIKKLGKIDNKLYKLDNNKWVPYCTVYDSGNWRIECWDPSSKEEFEGFMK